VLTFNPQMQFLFLYNPNNQPALSCSLRGISKALPRSCYQTNIQSMWWCVVQNWL